VTGLDLHFQGVIHEFYGSLCNARGLDFPRLTWAFGGGEGTRTLGLYIANVRFSVF
jgi:hypothetical protein